MSKQPMKFSDYPFIVPNEKQFVKKMEKFVEQLKACDNAKDAAKIINRINAYSEENVQLVVRKRKEALGDTFSAIPLESIELLKKLREKGLLTGLISNSFSDERDLIVASPLYPLFDVTMISYETGLYKPDPAVFKAMIEKLGVKPEQCLYIGDGGSRELYGARDAGMKAVQCTWFHDRGYEPHIPCPILDEFDHADHQSEVINFILS